MRATPRDWIVWQLELAPAACAGGVTGCPCEKVVLFPSVPMSMPGGRFVLARGSEVRNEVSRWTGTTHPSPSHDVNPGSLRPGSFQSQPITS